MNALPAPWFRLGKHSAVANTRRVGIRRLCSYCLEGLEGGILFFFSFPGGIILIKKLDVETFGRPRHGTGKQPHAGCHVRRSIIHEFSAKRGTPLIRFHANCLLRWGPLTGAARVPCSVITGTCRRAFCFLLSSRWNLSLTFVACSIMETESEGECGSWYILCCYSPLGPFDSRPCCQKAFDSPPSFSLFPLTRWRAAASV